MGIYIDYGSLVDQAMHVIVRKSLKMLASEQFIGDHHFFISFLTNHPEVQLSKKLKQRYPQEMTIVLQYQFEDLEVHKEYFSVVLSFDNVKEKVCIPYSSLTAFADPSVRFGLQFKHMDDNIQDYVSLQEEFDEEFFDEEEHKRTQDSAELLNHLDKNAGNVVNIDQFRKNKK